MAKRMRLRTRQSPPCGPACVKSAWKRLERWFGEHIPEVLRGLRKGASVRKIRSFEKAIGRELPEEVRESFQMHNGMETGSLFELQFYSLEEALPRWRLWQSMGESDPEDDFLETCFREQGSACPKDTIRLGYVNSAWIPLLNQGAGNHVGIDLDPDSKGRSGQVITFGRDREHKVVLAWTWGWFLTDVVEELERGNFRITDDVCFTLRDPPGDDFFRAAKAWSRAKLGDRRPRTDWTIDPAWLVWNGGLVGKLAQGIDDERAFDRLPILGDALEEAGCTDADILNHCRQPGEHVRGCRVVDLLTGKEGRACPGS